MNRISIEDMIIFISLCIMLLITGFLIFLIYIGVCDSIILLPYLSLIIGFYLGRVTKKQGIVALESSSVEITKEA